jgi:hypothetical protein
MCCLGALRCMSLRPPHARLAALRVGAADPSAALCAATPSKTRLQTVLSASRARTGRFGAPPPPGAQRVGERLGALAEALPSTSVRVLRTATAAYVLVGEDHYDPGSKRALAAEITELVTLGAIELYVEESESGKKESLAADELSESVGWTALEEAPPHEGSDDSLLLLLQPLVSAGKAEVFASRPEDLQQNIQVNHEALLQVVWFMRQCLDPRRERAQVTFEKAADLARSVLGSCLVTARHFEREGLLDSRLLPDIKSRLESIMLQLANAVRPLVAWPMLGAVRETLQMSPSPLFLALEASVFAPHLVSDAVFATRLAGRGFRDRPVVVVGGRAHAESLAWMLASLGRRVAEDAFVDSVKPHVAR